MLFDDVSDSEKSTPERASVEKIEAFDKEDWSRSPTYLKKLDLNINQDEDDAAFGKAKHLPLDDLERARRAALASKNERKRNEIRTRRLKVSESCRKKKEEKALREKERRIEGFRQRQKNDRMMNDIIEKKQLLLQAHYERQQNFRKVVSHKRERRHRKKKLEQHQKMKVITSRVTNHKLELDWRKKQFHQDPNFLSLVHDINTTAD